MNAYANTLIAALAQRGIAAEVAGTGGGCEQIAVLPDYRFGITDGDAGLPDNTDPHMQALVCEYDDEGTEEVAYREFREFDTPDHLAGAIASWITTRLAI